MTHVNPHKTAVLLAVLIGGGHLIWSILVALGWAQPLFNFIFWAHMIQPMFTVKPFDFTAAIVLVVVTTIIGYIVGFIAGAIWNKIHNS